MNNAGKNSNAQYTNEEWHFCMVDFRGGRAAEKFFGKLVRNYFEVSRLTGDLASQVSLRRHPDNTKYLCCNLPGSIIDVIDGPLKYFADQNDWYFCIYADGYHGVTQGDYSS